MPRALAVLALAVGSLATIGGCGVGPDEPPAPTGRELDGASVVGKVEHVVDGDTLRIRRTDGRSERVRLLGIDAPELSTTRTGYAECGAAPARDALAELAPVGSAVQVVADESQDERDRFGRLLGYLAPAGDRGGLTFQEQLLRDGWARVYVYAGEPFARVDAFRAAAAAARRERRGVWAACGGRFDRPAR